MKRKEKSTLSTEPTAKPVEDSELAAVTAEALAPYPMSEPKFPAGTRDVGLALEPEPAPPTPREALLALVDAQIQKCMAGETLGLKEIRELRAGIEQLDG